MTNVIVVDDDLANTTLIKMLLELDGFTVGAYATVEEAKKKAAADTDAFVVDYYLARGANGLELLHAVRNSETAAPAQTAFIITSGDYRREDDALEAGADRFLFKPYPPETLSKEIEKLLNRGDK
ncbi:MAG: response regulator [Ardenticatenaceae bacterium]|nr:response regulator [Ardenticatenaceae bacterium]